MRSNNNGFTLIELLITAVILLLVFGGLIGGCCALLDFTYSDGARVGVINKFSKKGVMWKTWEGELALEGITSTGTTVGMNVWQFSVDGSSSNEEELSKQLEKYRDLTKKVKIQYRQIMKPLPWRGETDYFVVSVEPVEQESKQQQNFGK